MTATLADACAQGTPIAGSAYTDSMARKPARKWKSFAFRRARPEPAPAKGSRRPDRAEESLKGASGCANPDGLRLAGVRDEKRRPVPGAALVVVFLARLQARQRPAGRNRSAICRARSATFVLNLPNVHCIAACRDKSGSGCLSARRAIKRSESMAFGPQVSLLASVARSP